MYVYSEYSEKSYRISVCVAFSDLVGDLSGGCCRSRSRTLALSFSTVVGAVVVVLLDGGGLGLKSSPLFCD